MTAILNEVLAVQNPALGASLIWRFSCGFTPQNSGVGTPLALAFVVLPLTYHSKSNDEISGTLAGSGLRKFEEKFRDRADLLLAIQPRMIAMRELSLRSIRIALAAGLVSLVPSEAVVWPRTYAPAPTDAKVVREMMKAAEKLGCWCREMSLFEVAGLLKVEF